jgi:DNA-directed RNA polymerase subunit RPC12/RpoP
MEYLQSLTTRLSKVVAVRKKSPLVEIRASDSRQGLGSSSNSERHALALGTPTPTTSGHGDSEVATARRCFRYCPRNREKRPVTAGGRRSSRKNAVQIMNRLDRLVQLHVANIGGRAFVTSPTATQVLRFVTLIDATGREHPILVQCCASFEQLQAMLKVALGCGARDALVQKRYLDAGLYDLSIDKGAQVVQVTGEASRWPSIDAGTKLIMRVVFQQKQRSCKLYRCQLCGASNSVDCRNPADWSGWLTERSIDCQECGGRFQILLEKKNGKKSMNNTPELDDNARACIRNFRVDAVKSKHVAFCAAGTEEVHEADDWDRSPVPVAPRLTYGDMLELKALQRDLHFAPQPTSPCSVLLPRVPIPLLRLNP